MKHNPYHDSDPNEGVDELALIDEALNTHVRQGCALRGDGRRGHGMNGKDADLTGCGQCVVTELRAVDPTDSPDLKIEIDLRLYATVCAPSAECFDHEAVIKNESSEALDYFTSIGADPRLIDWEDDSKEGANFEIIEKLADHYQEQAALTITGFSTHDGPTDDPFAIMWNDDAWEGGINVTLEVPMSCDEAEALESGGEVEVYDTIASRIATEIYAANEGGTSERDKLKRWEEGIAEWNREINKLGCYPQP